MKSGHRAKAYRLWRSGHEGLVTIQRLVDKAIEEAAESEPKETCFSGLPDLKLRINRELRDNAAFELRHRRESLELEDIELAHKTDLAYLKRVRDRVESQLRDLLALDDLQSVLGRKSTAARPPATAPADPGTPGPDLQSDADTASESLGNPEQVTIFVTGSSEMASGGPDGAHDPDQTESRTDETGHPGDTPVES